MTNLLIIDFETRSRVDLKTAGGDKYCQDRSTEILCMAACFSDPDDEREWLWYGYENEIPSGLAAVIRGHLEGGGLIAAHNARFDQQIWEYIAVDDHLFPPVPVDSWYCTSAQARVNALPANLDDATRALNAKHRKSHTGAALIRKLCIPNKLTGQFNENRNELHELGAYCLDDVRATKSLVNSCRLLSPNEHADWLANERINDRGIRIDRPLAEQASAHAAVETNAIGQELSDLTGGAVTKHTQNARIKDWLIQKVMEFECTQFIARNEHFRGGHIRTLSHPKYYQGQYACLPLGSRQIPVSPAGVRQTEFDYGIIHLMTIHKDGVAKLSLAKDIRANLLGRADAGALAMPDVIYNVIAALDDGNKSSVSKFKRMVERADEEDDRVRGAFMYAGAATLRYTSRGLQLHNFRRDCWKVEEAEQLRSMMVAGQKLDEGTVMDTLSKLLRPALVPAPGNVFVVNDWSGIESRALPWLADDPRAQVRLDAFAAYDAAPADDKPLDAYEEAARDAGTELRQVGKVVLLSLGYGGAVGAFNSMAKNYSVFLPEHEVKTIVARWRHANAWAETFWNALEKAAMLAVKNPGAEFPAGKVSYIFTYAYDRIDGTLMCRLPGDHYIAYPKPRVELVETQYGTQKQLTALKANWKPKADDTEWPRYKLWRGLLAENVDQAFCAALLRHSIRQVDDAVLHCHDEIGLEVPEEKAQAAANHLQMVMETPPEWAQGLPLAAEPNIMKRYGK